MRHKVIRHTGTNPLVLRLNNALADKGPKTRQTLLAIIEGTPPEELAKVWPKLAGHNCDRIWQVWRDRPRH